MKKLFYFGIGSLILFELAKVYFIMPMPGSQESDTLEIAYFLHRSRWYIRAILLILILATIYQTTRKKAWIPLIFVVLASVLIYYANFRLSADSMFLQPSLLTFKAASESQVDSNRLVLGITHNNQAKAYPIQYIGYHHQVLDSIAGKPIMVTYCTVCRTGRVFEPVVDNRPEKFRLVGMDHYNAMFEDETTGSWWRQATGEAVTGKNRGKSLPEFPSTQTSLKTWLDLYPHSLIMQPDEQFQEIYDSLSNYETGSRKGNLTRRDTSSWQDKSWIVGIEVSGFSIAYDWIAFEKEQIIHDVVGNTPIVLILANDRQSFFAFQRESKDQTFILDNDTLRSADIKYNLLGISSGSPGTELKRINAYQEYWHSWRTFHAETLRYPDN